MKPTSLWSRGIAVVGPEGSGKTTVINELKEILTVPIMKEYVREVMKDLDHKMPVHCNDLEVLKTFQDALANKRRALEVSFRGPFLADRSPLDSFLYALSAVARDFNSQGWLHQYFGECLRHAIESYQLLILIPHGKFCKAITPDGVRSTLWFNALMMHYLFMGAIPEFKVDYYVVEAVSIQDRVDEIVNLLSSRKLIE